MVYGYGRVLYLSRKQIDNSGLITVESSYRTLLAEGELGDYGGRGGGGRIHGGKVEGERLAGGSSRCARCSRYSCSKRRWAAMIITIILIINK